MRTTMILSGAALWVGVICFGSDDPRVAPKQNQPVSSQPAAKAVPQTKSSLAEQPPGVQAVAGKRSPDEEAIRAMNDSFLSAFGKGDAQSVAGHFTPDAEYVDELGAVSQGRETIEKSFKEFFTNNPGCKLEMNIDSIRFISPGVAVEDGHTNLTHGENQASADIHYTTLHVKTDGKWLAASIRDHAPKHQHHRQHSTQLQQLDWLIGDWVDEGPESVVNFSCEAVDKGNFLLRKFSILICGQEAMNGTQRIGWDPLTGQLKAWIFDSEGGHAEGTWHRDGDRWLLKSAGVTADGETASSTSIYTFVDEHSMTWQSVHHEVAGVQLPDSEVVRIVRQAPPPMIAVERK